MYVGKLMESMRARLFSRLYIPQLLVAFAPVRTVGRKR